MEKDLNMEKCSIFRNVNKNLSGEDIMMLSPLQLAYIGDAVYELLVRTSLLDKDTNVNQLNKLARKYVKAEGQSKIVHELEELLTDDEKYYVKKGRNTKTNSSPKNADMIDYKYATGFECLFGYLYLSHREERIQDLFECIQKMEI